MTLLAVMLAGAAGAASRFTVDLAATRRWTRRMPVGTLLVNVVGSAMAGVLAGVVARHGVDPAVRSAVGTGFLAAFTTFSTFAVDTVRLAEAHARGAVLNVVANLLVGTGAAALGYVALVAT